MDSNLQKKMVIYQKQSITASLAAESGAVIALHWLQLHPNTWGDEKAWRTENGLPFGIPPAPNLSKSTVYWIKSIHFDGDTAVIVSHGGTWEAGKILGESAVMIVLKNETYHSSMADNNTLQNGDTPSSSDKIYIQKDILNNIAALSTKSNYENTNRINNISTKIQKMKIKVFTWRPLIVTDN